MELTPPGHPALAAMFGGLHNYLGKGLTAKMEIYALYEQEGPYTELKVLHALLALLCKRSGFIRGAFHADNTG